MLKLGTALAACLALAAPFAATAQPAGGSSDDTIRIVVAYGDLNLATPEGAQALRARVDHAAMMVVGSVDPRDLQQVAVQRRARAAALETANAIIAANTGSAYAANSAAPKTLRL
jgi:UrcA family protein